MVMPPLDGGVTQTTVVSQQIVLRLVTLALGLTTVSCIIVIIHCCSISDIVTCLVTRSTSFSDDKLVITCY